MINLEKTRENEKHLEYDQAKELFGDYAKV